MVVATVFGVGRVALTAAAAQTSLDSAKLRKEIKSARYEGDMLEVQQSALAAPSRVRRLAGDKLSLSEPASVCYLGIEGKTVCKPKKVAKKPAAKKAVAPKAKPAPKPEQSGVSALVSKVMDIAAGEAPVLMVGDVGLASAR